MSDFLDFTDVQEISFELIINGWYPMRVEDAEFKESSSGNEYLSCVFEITEGDYEGRKIFQNYNLYHSKEDVRNIAASQFKTLLTACGFSSVSFESQDDLVNQIIGKEFDGKVGRTKGSDQYEPQNTVKAYKELEKKEDAPF